MPWIVAAVACATLVGTVPRLLSRRSPPVTVPAQFEITLPEDMRVDSTSDRAEISPDGRRLVFTANLKGRPQLFMRDLGSTALVGVEDTESALLSVLVT